MKTKHMNKILFLILAGSLFISEALAQKVEPGPVADNLLKTTPQEQIYLHHNSSLLFPGEYLLYKVYNLNEENTGSELSKVAYVELVGKQGNRVFKQKIKLTEGKGQADFFIPTSVSSGNYKLLAYTNWMRNTGNFYQGDVIIINPYRGRQAALENSESPEALEREKSDGKLPDQESPFLELDLNKQEFETREKVVLRLVRKYKELENLSISVRKKEEFGIKNPMPAETYIKKEERISTSSEDDVFLPELRGQLYHGKIIARDGSRNKNLGNLKVAISVPSEGLVPITAVTDENGIFFFNLDKDASAEKAALEVLGNDRDKYEIQLLTDSVFDPATLNFSDFQLTPTMEDLILTRSVHNQVENSYFTVKPDTLVTAEEGTAFYENIAERYDLDDFTRFKTIPETFVEIINSAWIRTDATGKRVFAVRGITDNIDMNLLPLISIDGVFIQDHEDLIDMEAKQIKNISLIRDKLYVGAEVFQGAILAETVEGDYFEKHAKSYTTKVELMRPEIRKKYFRQEYDQDSNLSRIPDYRYQLLWEPNLKLEEEEQEVEFFTSDVPGTYEISIEGFTENGEPISVRRTFKVKENN